MSGLAVTYCKLLRWDPESIDAGIGIGESPAACLWRSAMTRKKDKLGKITIKKEELRPRERAPILPSKQIEDRRKKEERREKHKKNLRRLTENE